MVFYSIFILYYLVILWASVMLIQGTKRRDHSRMVLFMVIMAIGVVFQFLQILTAGWATLASAILMACISFYFFLCIYSLYSVIKSESLGRPYV
jgi:CHASE2 domain-containing sensor protein